MTGVHQFLGVASALATGVLVVVSVWSWLAARSSAGGRDHRLALDRAILFLLVGVAAAGLVGGALFLGGSRPSDGLHLLYGAAAFVTPLVGWWFAARRTEGAGLAGARRDGFLVIAALILVGVIVRLFLTG